MSYVRRDARLQWIPGSISVAQVQMGNIYAFLNHCRVPAALGTSTVEPGTRVMEGGERKCWEKCKFPTGNQTFFLSFHFLIKQEDSGFSFP